MLPAVEALVRALARLPGFGSRSAERAALALLRRPEQLCDPLRAALDEARAQVRCCPACGAFLSLREVCAFCSDPSRDDTLLCVVEEPADVYSIERSGGFRGRFHALMGRLTAERRADASDPRVGALLSRVKDGGVKEVLLALSTDMDGDAAAGYLTERLRIFPGVRISRLAFGLPADSGVRYSDPLTLRRAINGRIPAE